jgi:DNA replication protein DnaC
MQLKWKNETAGSLEGYNCPDCMNRGSIYYLKGEYIIARECRCMELRRSMRRMEKSGLKDLIERYTFEKYQTPEQWQQSARGIAVKFAGEPEGSWFAALGAVGSGKTHLCTAICGTLIKRGYEVRYMLWKDAAQTIKAVTNESEEYDRLIYPLQTVKVLYIDDFWKTKKDEKKKECEPPSSADIDLAFKIINARYNNVELITIISSEKSMDELLNIDEAVGSRIYERSKRFLLKLTGEKNWRLK